MAENSIRSISDIALKSQQAQNRLVEGLDDLEKISAGINEITSGSVTLLSDKHSALNAAVEAARRVKQGGFAGGGK
jgi:methyl-accepting chemotaxis protein